MAEYSPTRTHATWKPRVTSAHIPYFHCTECGAVVQGIDGAVDNQLINDGERSLILMPSYAHVEYQLTCCGKPMEQLQPITAAEVEDRFKLNYQIMGGLNNNCVKIDWRSVDSTCKLVGLR